MTLFRLLIGWTLVSLWFLAWDLARRRFGRNSSPRGPQPGPGSSPRDRFAIPIVEALLLTLFAGLWFASLGHGGWLLLFLMVGLLMEVPVRLRDGLWTLPPPWPRLAGSLVRVMVAGGVLAWRLG